MKTNEKNPIIAEKEKLNKTRYTGWYVLLKKEDCKWVSVGCIDPYDDIWEDKEMPDFDVILPIPDPTTIGEFQGF